MAFKSGFVAVIGKPNVGKSSLVNALVGEKVSITSPKAQTTRNRIFGIKNADDYQIVFVDTPGVQHTKTKLGEYMSQATDGATADVDAIVIVLDALRVNQEDFKIIEKYKKVKCPIFIVVNKIETTNFEKMYPILDKLNKYDFVKKFITTSARRGINVDELERELVDVMPEGQNVGPGICQSRVPGANLLQSQFVIQGSIFFIVMIIIDKIPHQCVGLGLGCLGRNSPRQQETDGQTQGGQFFEKSHI